MVIINLILFLFGLFVVIKCAGYSILYSSKIARTLHLQEFIVSFFIITIVSALPEATISIMSAVRGDPAIGFGTLIGSNIADLTIVFGIVALFSSGGIRVRSKILRNNSLYLFLLLLPLLLGFDGKLSRLDGVILISVGILFFYRIYKESKRFSKKFSEEKRGPFIKSSILLILSLAILIISAFFTVKYAENFANEIKIPAMLIGITILAIGTCLPELAFSIKAVRNNHDQLALGDILGTVITDGTILLGIVALISPFTYTPLNIYILGGGMFLAGVFTMMFMKSDKSLNKKEGLILILLYILFIFIEFFFQAI